MADMTDDQVRALLDGATPRFLIRKHGGYYRPNCQGYTSSAILAGRYTEAKAISETHPNGPNGPRDGMTYTSEDAITDEDFAAYIALREQRDDLATALLDARAELTRLRADAAAMDDAVAHYPHPGYGKPYPITTVLRDLASQEGCDGEPYDAMMFAAKTIDDMRAGRQALVRSTLERAARVAKHRHEVWAAGDGFWDADGLPAVECDVTACDNIADAILALRTAPPPVSEYERKVTQMKEDFPNGI